MYKLLSFDVYGTLINTLPSPQYLRQSLSKRENCATPPLAWFGPTTVTQGATVPVCSTGRLPRSPNF